MQAQGFPNVRALVEFVLSNPIYAPQYEVVERLARELGALDPGRAPYRALSLVLSIAYDYQLAGYAYDEARRFGKAVTTPPLLVEVEEDSLPDRLLPVMVDVYAGVALLYARDTHEAIRRGYYVSRPILPHNIEAIIAIGRNREDVEAAMEFYDLLKRQVSNYATLIEHYEFEAHKVMGDVEDEITIVNTMVREADYKTLIELAKANGMEVKEYKLERLTVYVAERKFGNVTVLLNVDDRGFGFMMVYINDPVKGVDAKPQVYENITIKQYGQELRQLEYTVTVQQSGHKLVLNLTRVLRMLGLGPGSRVRVRVEDGRRIVLEPA